MSNNSKCPRGHVFHKTYPFITIPLSIEVGQNEVYNVEKGIDTFFATTTLDEDNWLYCEECEKKTETETWNKIEEFPTILTLHLKRFEFSYEQMSLVKNNCPTDIPHRLHKKVFIHQIPESSDYDLYAVINHRGGRSGGHYNALIKSFADDEWYCFDDTSVTKDSVASLHHSQLACLLMYKKKTEKSSLMESLTQWKPLLEPDGIVVYYFALFVYCVLCLWILEDI